LLLALGGSKFYKERTDMTKIILEIDDNMSEKGKEILINWIKNSVYYDKSPENLLKFVSKLEILESNNIINYSKEISPS
jgi:hypothetical protein